MIATANNNPHDPYCVSFFDNRCRCPNCGYYHHSTTASTDEYIHVKYKSYSYTPLTPVQQFNAEIRKHQIYYEAIGRCRELAKTKIPDIIPKIRLENKVPTNKCHKLRCMKMRPRLSILKRIAKRH